MAPRPTDRHRCCVSVVVMANVDPYIEERHSICARTQEPRDLRSGVPTVGRLSRFVFDRSPQRIYWEVTRTCSLACRHCRAEASPRPDPRELDRAEGIALIDHIASFGDPKPHIILTGGDPLERADLFDLIAHA